MACACLCRLRIQDLFYCAKITTFMMDITLADCIHWMKKIKNLNRLFR
jgi:hypothetical protein